MADDLVLNSQTLEQTLGGGDVIAGDHFTAKAHAVYDARHADKRMEL